MHGEVPPSFDREQGCTEAEWERWLPGAAGRHALRRDAPHQASVAIGSGRLHLQWSPLPPRQIALMRMPRLQLTFRFDGVTADERRDFMRYFDLYLQRGGG